MTDLVFEKVSWRHRWRRNERAGETGIIYCLSRKETDDVDGRARQSYANGGFHDRERAGISALPV